MKYYKITKEWSQERVSELKNNQQMQASKVVLEYS